jgi:hypothetical protein
MSAVAVKGVLEALHSGRVVVENCRGRSAWDRAGQAAELAVRELTGEDDADALTARTGEPAPAAPDGARLWPVTVAHADGRSWRVAVRQETGPPALPASCGAPAEPQARFVVAEVEAAA